MAENIGMLLLGAVALGGILWYTGALCQQDIANGALCPPGKGIWRGPDTSQGQEHFQTHGIPGQSGRNRRNPMTSGQPTGYGDDGYGDYYDFESNAAHISVA